jgi:hypothetical protein
VDSLWVGPHSEFRGQDPKERQHGVFLLLSRYIPPQGISRRGLYEGSNAAEERMGVSHQIFVVS